MKKIYLLLLMLIVGIGSSWADATVTWSTPTAMSYTDFVAMAGTSRTFGLQAVSSNTATYKKWFGFTSANSRVSTITTAQEFTLEGTADAAQFKRVSDSQYLSAAATFGETAMDVKLVNRTAGDYSSEFTAAMQTSIDNSEGNHYNADSYTFKNGTGGWSAYVAFETYTVASVEFTDEGGNTLATALSNTILLKGSLPSIAGYTLTTDPTGGAGISGTGSYTFKFTKTPVVVTFGNSTGVSGLTTDAFSFSGVTNPSETLSDGNSFNFTTSGGSMNFWSGATDGGIEGYWQNAAAIQDINTELATSTALDSTYFNSSSTFYYTATGNGGSYSTLNLSFPNMFEGQNIVLYASIAERGGTLTNFSATGLANTKIQYAINTGSGFSDSQAFSTRTGSDNKSPITIVKITGILTADKTLALSSTNEKNGWQMLAYKFKKAPYTVSNTQDLDAITNYTTYDYIYVPEGATLNVNVANYDLTKIVGSGNVVLKADNSLADGKNTGATGTLTVNEGTTLSFGSGEGTNASIKSFNSVVLSGKLSYNTQGNEIKNLTIPEGKTGIIYSNDMGSETDGYKMLLSGTTTINSGSKLITCNHWNYQQEISTLAGSGTWEICGTTQESYTYAHASSEKSWNTVKSATTFTGTIDLNNTPTDYHPATNSSRLIVEGNLVGCTIKKTEGDTIKYMGSSLSGTTLDGVILAGGSRITIGGDSVTIKNLAGNNLTAGMNGYVFVSTDATKLALYGTCDFSKTSIADSTTTYTNIGIGNANGCIIVKNGASVKCGKIWHGNNLTNAAIKVEEGGSLVSGGSIYASSITVDGSLTASDVLYSNSITNNGNITATKLNPTNTLAAGSVTTLSNATPFGGATTVSGNATVNLKALTSTLSQAITIADGDTLTISAATDSTNNTVSLTGAVTFGTNSAIHVKNAVFNITPTVRSLAGYKFTGCTATAKFDETTDEYKAGGFTITNVPEGITVLVKKYGETTYDTVAVANNTAKYSHTVEVAGHAAWLDYTFDKSTLADHLTQATTASGRIISNTGNAGTGVNLQLDKSWNETTSYDSISGNLYGKTQPYRAMSGDTAWPDNYSVAVYSNVPNVENGCLMAFGSSTSGTYNWIAIARAKKDEIKVVYGNGTSGTVTELPSMAAQNASSKKHLVVMTKNGNQFKVYLDGTEKASVTYSNTLGNGFQVGSIHGGIHSSLARLDLQADSIQNAVKVGAIRVYKYVLSDAQQTALATEFPYESAGGNYTRTFTGDENLSETDAWEDASKNKFALPVAKTDSTGTSYDPTVTFITSGKTNITVNANAQFDKVTFQGGDSISLAASGSNKITVTGSTNVNTPVVMKYNAMEITKTPVAIGTSGDLTVDYTDYDFSEVYDSTKVQVTGYMSQNDAKVHVKTPTTYAHLTYSVAYNESDHFYWMTVAPDRKPCTVYLPSDVTTITDGMSVATTSGGEANSILLAGDTVAINTAGTYTFNESVSIYATINVGDGNEVKVVNNTAGTALNGETINITSGTLTLHNNNQNNNDAVIESATINIGTNGYLDNYGWMTVNGTLTITSDAAKTILHNGSYSNKAVIQGSGKLVIPANVTVDAYVQKTMNVSGAGNITLQTFPSSSDVSSSHVSNWTGTVTFPSTTSDVGNLSTVLNNWGATGSKVILNSVGTTGTKSQGAGTYFPGGQTINPTIEIAENATVILNNGSNGTTDVISELTGKGTLSHEWTANPYNLTITKASSFTGTLSTSKAAITISELAFAAGSNVTTAGTKLLGVGTHDGTITITKITVGGTEETPSYTMLTDGIYVYATTDERTTASGKLGSICLPYTATVSGAKVYTANVVDDAVVLTKIAGDGGVIAAGTPCIYYATTNASQTFTKTEDAEMVTEPLDDFDLKGSFVPMTVPVGAYVLQTINGIQKFRIVVADKQPSMNAYRCYVTVPANSGDGNARQTFGITFNDDTPTAIDAIGAITDENAQIYDINGRKQTELRKGINIVNGVKVIVR